MAAGTGAGTSAAGQGEAQVKRQAGTPEAAPPVPPPSTASAPSPAPPPAPAPSPTSAPTPAPTSAPTPAPTPAPAPPAVEPGGPGRHRIYITVFAALAVLTAMELSVNRLVHVKSVQVGLLVPMMLAKASLVVLYYMHLRYESRVLKWAILVPFGMAIFFAIVVIVGGR